MPLARAIALNVIKSLVPLNLPAGQVISVLQRLNVTYRRTDMLSDIRTAFDRQKYEEQVTRLSDNQVVPEAWMNTETLGMPYNYRVHLKVDFYDTVTGQYVTEHRYMFEDDVKKIGDYKADYPDYAIGRGSDPDLEYMDSTVVGITRNDFGEVPF